MTVIKEITDWVYNLYYKNYYFNYVIMKNTITVQQLLDELNKIEDKSKPVYHYNNVTFDYCNVNVIEENEEEVFLSCDIEY